MSRDEKIAEAAAKWWADHLRKPVVVMDNGVLETSMLASLIANKEALPAAACVSQFESALAEALARRLAADEDGYLSVGVDYHPDQILTQAGEDSRCSLRRLPWKTRMWIERGSVSVSEGYGAEQRRIYPVPA